MMENLITFQDWFKERYPDPVDEDETLISDMELAALGQEETEILQAYYKRAMTLLRGAGG